MGEGAADLQGRNRGESAAGGEGWKGSKWENWRKRGEKGVKKGKRNVAKKRMEKRISIQKERKLK